MWGYNPYFGVYTFIPGNGRLCDPYYGYCYWSPNYVNRLYYQAPPQVYTNNGGGTYRGQFTGVANPGTVRVDSSLGGSATRAVAGATGTVRPVVTTPIAAGPAAGAKSIAPSSAAAPVLHATPQVALGAPESGASS